MADLTLSVCTGALVLARLAARRAGGDDLSYGVEELKAVAPNTVQRPDERWVDNGCIVASAASRQASTCRCTS